jgi:Uncharacterized conserved protein (DUF2190)
MPKQKAGGHYYTTATKAVRHGAPTVEQGVAGIAVKQVEPPLTGAYADRDLVAIGEAFEILHKGQVEVDTVAGFAKGDPVYITAATNVLSETAAGNVAFGRVVEVAGERGTPTGQVRIDLDER